MLSGFALQTYHNTVSIGTTKCIITDVNTGGTQLDFIVPNGVLSGDTFKIESFVHLPQLLATFTLLNITMPTGLNATLSGTTATFDLECS